MQPRGVCAGCRGHGVARSMWVGIREPCAGRHYRSLPRAKPPAVTASIRASAMPVVRRDARRSRLLGHRRSASVPRRASQTPCQASGREQVADSRRQDDATARILMQAANGRGPPYWSARCALGGARPGCGRRAARVHRTHRTGHTHPGPAGRGCGRRGALDGGGASEDHVRGRDADGGKAN